MVGRAAKSTLRYGLTAPGDRSSRRASAAVRLPNCLIATASPSTLGR
jgi:hypothetical protein